MFQVSKDKKYCNYHLTLNAYNAIQLYWTVFKQVSTKTSIILLKIIAGSIFVMK